MSDPGLYGRSFADTYDRWYGELDDPAALVGACRERLPANATIIEMGAGTGRLAIPLEDARFRVISLDASVEMLRPNSSTMRVSGDMSVVPIRDHCADAIIVAYNTLFNLAGQATRSFFHECARVLVPGGRVAIEAFIAAPLTAGSSIDVTTRPTNEDEPPVVIVSEQARADGGGRGITGSHIEIRADQIVCRPWRLRYFSPAELDALAESAGLSLSSRSADWAGSPFDESGPGHVSWYRSGAKPAY